MKALAYAAVALGIAVGVISMFRSGMGRRGGPAAGRVPPAMRPAGTDDVLETDRINKVLRWGLISVVFMAVFLPAYWFAEPGRQKAVANKFDENSLRRGKSYFAMRTDPVTGEENLSGVECARCHGSNLEGGQNTFVDPKIGEKRTVQVPELKHVFARYEKPPAGYKDARAFIVATIERGRTDGVLGVGADMPTWSNQFGGPLTEQMIDDVVNYIASVQAKLGEEEAEDGAAPDGAQIFAQFCAACHGPAGAGGGIGPAMTGGSEARQFPNIDDHIAFVKSGSAAGKSYGASGKGTGAMPAWGTSLTDAQIRAVVEYERSL